MAVAHYDSKMGSDNIGKIDEVLTALPSWMHFYDKIPGKVNKKTGQIEIKAKTRSATKKESMINEVLESGTSTTDLKIGFKDLYGEKK